MYQLYWITGWFSNNPLPGQAGIGRGIIKNVGGAFTVAGWSRFSDWGKEGSQHDFDGSAFNANLVSNLYLPFVNTVQPLSIYILIMIKF